jgi:hypothetical protein
VTSVSHIRHENILMCGPLSAWHSELIKTWMGTRTPQSSPGSHSSELHNGSQASVTDVLTLKMCYLEHRHHKYKVLHHLMELVSDSLRVLSVPHVFFQQKITTLRRQPLAQGNQGES